MVYIWGLKIQNHFVKIFWINIFAFSKYCLNSHLLIEEDIKEILDYKPELLIIGTGAYGLMKVDDSLKRKLKELGIEFIINKTSEAVNEYNKIYKDKKVVAALYLTC